MQGRTLFLGALLVHCNTGPEPESVMPGPAPTAVGIWAPATPMLGGAWAQVDETTALTVDGPLAVRFDRFLDPSSTNRQAFCLRADLKTPRSYHDCGGAIFIAPAYDPARMEVRLNLAMGEHLAPGTLYQLTVLPVDGDEPEVGLRAFDGAEMQAAIVFRFRTAESLQPLGKSSPPTCANVAQVFASCGGSSCHGSPSPSMGLLLEPASRLKEALGRVAHQTQSSEHASEPELSPRWFGRSMPVIAPNVPGQSYLVYKLLANPTLWSEQPPDAPFGTAAPSELVRLQSAGIVGMWMPPDTAPPLSSREVQMISDWIAAGADMSDCDATH